MTPSDLARRVSERARVMRARRAVIVLDLGDPAPGRAAIDARARARERQPIAEPIGRWLPAGRISAVRPVEEDRREDSNA